MDQLLINKKGVQFSKGGRVLYKSEHGAGLVLFTVREDPSHAIIRVGDRDLEIAFASPLECAQAVLLARAYSAWDTLCLICSLPPVNKEITPDVSIVNALIQAGSAVQPFTWGPQPELEPPMPEVEDREMETLTNAVQKLVASRRIKASTQAMLMGLLSAISQGSAPIALPRPQAWVEPESEEEPEEEPEEEEEEEMEMGGAGGFAGTPAAPGTPISEAECLSRLVRSQ